MTHRLASATVTQETTYTERLYPSIGVWVFLLGIAASLGIAFGRALGARPGAIAFGVCMVGVFVLGLFAIPKVIVSDGSLRIGRSSLPGKCMGQTRILDADATRVALTTNGHRGAFIVTRGWIATSVVIPVTDTNDPHPYWQVSTRHPEALCAALEAARS